MKRCMYCGQVNEDNSAACTKCGNPLFDTPLDGDKRRIEESLDAEPQDAQPVDDEAVANIRVEEPEDTDSIAVEPELQQNAEYDNEEEQGIYDDEDYAYDAQDDRGQLYDDPDYGYDEQQPYDDPEYYDDDESQQYGGQAYGYEDDPREYGRSRGYDDDYDRSSGHMTSLMRKSRKRVKSFLFFLPVLFFTAHMAAQILNIVLGNALTNLSTVSNTVERQFGSSSVITLMNTGISYLNGVDRLVLMGVSLALLIPQLLLLLGLWSMFFKTSRRYTEISTSGYTLARVGLILRFIMVCLVLLAVIAVAVSFVVAAGASGSTMSLIVGVVVLLVAVILAVLIIMYHIQVIFSVRLIRRAVKNGDYIGRIPGFAIFCGLLSCAFTVVSMLPMAPDDYIGLAANGSYAAWLLFITIWAIVYRATVKEQ